MTSHSWGFTLRRPPARRPRAVLAAGLAATAVLVAACGSTAAAGHAPGAPATGAGMASQPMPGMAGDIPGQGLLAAAAGPTPRPVPRSLPARPARAPRTITAPPRAGRDTPMTIPVPRHGHPVTSLQPYLGAYAHLTAFHQGDLGFAHLHPSGPVHGDHGGPVLHFRAVLPESGRYRLFVQFQAGGTLHTAQVTLPAS